MKITDISCAILCWNYRFALFRRSPDRSYGGWWEFPGGKVEPGETASQAILRELIEERVTFSGNPSPGPIVDHRYDDIHVRLHCFIFSCSTRLFPGNDHDALIWLPISKGYDTCLQSSFLNILASDMETMRLMKL